MARSGPKWCYAFFFPTTKAYVEFIGREKAIAYLQCIYYKNQTSDPKRNESYNQIKMCMCVDIWWIVANLILLCSLKTCLSLETWKYFCERIRVILFISSFFSRASEYPLFSISRTLAHFSQFSFFHFFFFFMNNFCIAPCLFSAIELWERYQQDLKAFIWSMENLTSMFLYSLPV